MTKRHQLLNYKIARKQNVFSPPINAPKGSIKDFFLLAWQIVCVKKLKDEPYWIITAPMGAGKTLVLLALAWIKLRKDPELRIIISGPQKIICSGYTAAGKLLKRIWLGDNDPVIHRINPTWDLSGDTEGKVLDVLNFLTRINSGSVSDRFLVCPHSTLRKAFTQNPAAFTHVLTVIDEAHHSEFGMTDNNTWDGNDIGKLIQHAIENPECNIQIGLATATPYRGNRTPMFLREHKKLFAPYELSWPAFFETTNIVSFTHDFLLYTGSVVEPIEKIFRNSFQPTICFIPRVRSVAASGNKYDDAEMFYEAIAGCSNPQIRHPNGPVTEVYSVIENRWLKGVNLVVEINRSKKIERIIQDDNANERELDFIVALQMFIEGANWKWATREIIIGQRDSFTEYIQMLGRLFRSTPTGTKLLEFFHLLPYSLVEPDEASLRKACNLRLNAVIYLMLAVDILIPASIQLSDDSDESRNTLDDTFGNDASGIFRQIMIEVIRIAATQTTVTRDQLFAIVETILIERGDDLAQTENYVNRIMHIQDILNNRILRLPDGIDVEPIALDLVSSGGILGDGPLLHFLTEGLGAHTWNACFDVLKTTWDAKFMEVKVAENWQGIYKDRSHPLNVWVFRNMRDYNDGIGLENYQRTALESLPGWKDFDGAWARQKQNQPLSPAVLAAVERNAQRKLHNQL